MKGPIAFRSRVYRLHPTSSIFIAGLMVDSFIVVFCKSKKFRILSFLTTSIKTLFFHVSLYFLWSFVLLYNKSSLQEK